MVETHDSLVRAAANGDAQAQNALFERHLPSLLAYVRIRAGAQLRAIESSLDLVQSTCREVLQGIGRRPVRDEAGFRQWLYTAAERKILDKAKHHRRLRRDAARLEALPEQVSAAEADCLSRAYGSFYTPSRQAMLRDEMRALEATLGQLAEDDREVIVLAYLVGLPHAEIARKLDRSEGAVRVLLHRALARLSRRMGSA